MPALTASALRLNYSTGDIFDPRAALSVQLRSGSGEIAFLSQGDLLARASYKMWNTAYESEPAAFSPWNAAKYLSQEGTYRIEVAYDTGGGTVRAAPVYASASNPYSTGDTGDFGAGALIDYIYYVSSQQQWIDALKGIAALHTIQSAHYQIPDATDGYGNHIATDGTSVWDTRNYIIHLTGSFDIDPSLVEDVDPPTGNPVTGQGLNGNPNFSTAGLVSPANPPYGIKSYFGDKPFVKVSIRGGYTIRLGAPGCILRLNAENQTLILREAALDGNGAHRGGAVSNNERLVVLSGGAFIMQSGVIQNNDTSASEGSGVLINGGMFDMSGGAIRNNNMNYGGITYGAGLCFFGIIGGTTGFGQMTGGVISGNTTGSNGSGGGVSIDRGAEFTLVGGEISENSASYGGGVYIGSDDSNGITGTFRMAGGKIRANASFYNSDGLYMYGDGRIRLLGGEISGNDGVGLALEGGQTDIYKTAITGNPVGGIVMYAIVLGAGSLTFHPGGGTVIQDNAWNMDRYGGAGPLMYYKNTGTNTAPVWVLDTWTGSEDTTAAYIRTGTSAAPFIGIPGTGDAGWVLQ